MIYLDYAANTPADERVLRHFCDAERRFPANANAHHSAGRAARAEMERATDEVKRLLNAPAYEVIFTSGASEANNLAVKGLVPEPVGAHILTTPLEHASVLGSVRALEEQGATVETVPVLPDGTLDPARLRTLLRPETALLAVHAADSELGSIQPLAPIVSVLREFPHCRLHVDATQAAGKLPLELAGADTVSLTAHKFYGLNGIGALLRRRSIALKPMIHGGAGAAEERSGTPTVALASSLAFALGLAQAERETRFACASALNRRVRAALSAYPRVRFNSPQNASPYILNLSVDGVKGTVFQRELDKCGICVSVKSACSSDGQPSRAVMALGGDRWNALSSWRVSFSHETTEKEIDEFLTAFGALYERLTGKKG